MKRNFLRITYTLIGSILSLLCQGQVDTSRNYVITNVIKTSGITSQSQIDTLAIATQGKAQTIAYVDGLGRPLQTVITKGSASQKDIVSPFVYDGFSRQPKKLLSYVDTSTTGFGGYKTNWSTRQPAFYTGLLAGVDTSSAAYSRTVFESSPLNRVLAQGAPGIPWQPNMTDSYDTSAKVLKIRYANNKTEDSVRIFSVDSAGSISASGFYAGGLLSVKISFDEHNGILKEFTDKSGHILLRRVFIANDSLQTYYVYDDFDLLRAVIQPEGVAAISGSSWTLSGDFVDKWVFLYRYDGRGRPVMKKVPGADSVLMIYDRWDRLRLTQDGNLRGQHRWLFIKYDVFNRPIVTGSIMDTRSQSAIRGDVFSDSLRYEMPDADMAGIGYMTVRTFPKSADYTITYYTITFYDNHDVLDITLGSSLDYFTSEHGVTTKNNFTRGQVTARLAKKLNTDDWMFNVPFYDDKYRIVQENSTNITGGSDRITSVLSFEGKVQETYQTHTSSFYPSGVQLKKTYTYDNGDRLKKITNAIDSGEVVTVSETTYNELGQALTKKLHQSASHPNALQKLDYSYNIRGWLNGVNQPYGDGAGYEEDDLFNFALHYNTANLSGATVQYNGNIAEQVWKGGYDEYLRGYKYSYDKANRLLEANYAFKYVNFYNDTVWDFTHRYDEKIDQYDRNGNIKQLERYHNAWNKIDELHYSGWDGNKLLRVDDWVFSNLPVGFHDGNSWIDDYRYDQNGNMTFDFNKSIDSIHYNHLNLPDTITVSGKGGIRYIYDAAGNKLQKTVTDTTGGATKITTYKYAGAFVYKNDTLELVNHEEGRIRPLKIDTTQAFSPSNVKYTYDYFLKDHLGNVRMVLSTEQQTDIYAATLETAAATKEEQLFTNLSSTRYAKPTGFDADGSNAQVARLNGDINTGGNHRVGPSLVIKVMAGDTISLATRAWYSGSTQAPPSGLTPIADEIVSLLSNGVVAAGGTHGGNVSTGDISDGVGAVVNDFLDNAQSYDNSKPKAFLNWMVVDEEFKKVTATYHRGAVQVPTIGSGDTAQLLVGPSNMVVRRGGWLYVYVSNESNQDVFFDNIVVSHKRGPVVEVNEYYPFGYQIPGISSMANRGSDYALNRRKYNGIEETKELGLEEYDAYFRNLDPLTGRWWQIDPKIEDEYESFSPYTSMNDDPSLLSDPAGDVPECCKVIVDALKTAAKVAVGVGAAVVVGTIDNLAGTNIRGSVASSNLVKDADIAAGWNSGLDAADVSSSALGAAEGGFGSGLMSGSATVTGVSGGASIEVTGPTLAAGASMVVHSGFVMKNAAANLVSRNGRVNVQGSGDGRGKNNRKPDPSATGDHTVSDGSGSTTYEKNDRNPHGFQEVKRVDTKGRPHGNIPTPHVKEKGRIRSARADEIPQTDLSKNAPPVPTPTPPSTSPPTPAIQPPTTSQ